MTIVIKSENLTPRVRTFGDLYDDPDTFDDIISTFDVVPEIDSVDDLAAVVTRTTLRKAFGDPNLSVGFVN